MKLRIILGAAALTFTAATAQAQSNGAKQLLNSFDANGDGSVSLEEAQNRRAKIFNTLDRDRDDELTREELVRRIRLVEQALSTGGIDKSLSKDQIDGLIEVYDQNGNGTISNAEYNRGEGKWFAFKDKNNDGVLNADDSNRR